MDTSARTSETHLLRRERGQSVAEHLTISCFAADFTNRPEAHLTSELQNKSHREIPLP
jgi:hypothetical protein